MTGDRRPRSGWKKRELAQPVKGTSVNTAFNRARKLLEIDDLHFRDMRHEAACAPDTFSLGLWTTLRDVSRIKMPLARSTPRPT